jgi:hypothetical protein
MKNQYWKLGLVVFAFIAACGGNKEALYTRGPMPMNGNFDGVYSSDFGRMELTVEGGSTVVGLYENNDKYGRLEGEIKDNLLLFSWTQWDVNMRGKLRETTGRGVFQYMVEEAPGGGAPTHWLKGFWAYAKDPLTNPWKAYKLGAKAQKKLEPFDPSKYTGNDEEEEDNSGNFEGGGQGGGQGGEGGGESGGQSGGESAPAPSGDQGGGDAEIF